MPDGSKINELNNVKYLSVYFDNNLKFKRHIDIVSCRLNRMVGILWKIKHLNTETKRVIYHALVESHLNYGILVWGSVIAKYLTSLDFTHIPDSLKQLAYTQNKIIRAIFRKPKFNKDSQTYS